MNDQSISVSAELIGALDDYISALVQSPAFDNYRQAGETLENDEDAIALLDRFSDLRNRYWEQQQMGSASDSLVAEVTAAQSAVQSNDTINNFVEAQRVATDYYKEMNREISDALGMDFALLAKRSCG